MFLIFFCFTVNIVYDTMGYFDNSDADFRTPQVFSVFCNGQCENVTLVMESRNLDLNGYFTKLNGKETNIEFPKQEGTNQPFQRKLFCLYTSFCMPYLCLQVIPPKKQAC